MILVDLKAKHTELGCRTTNGNGKEPQLLDKVDSTETICLNDGTPTCYPVNGTTPDQLDYCIISPSLHHRTEFRIAQDLGSDHLPQIVTIATKATDKTTETKLEKSKLD